MKLAVIVSEGGKVLEAKLGYGVTWGASVTGTKRDRSFLAPDRHHGDRDLRESEVKAGENGIACLLDDGLWAD